MATAATLVQSEAGGKSPGSLRVGRSRRRQVAAAAQLVMLWGAAAALTWASLATACASPEPEVATVASPVRALSGSNWSLLLQGQWMVEFYAPWCPACQQMESTWEAFARESKHLEIGVGKVDVTVEPGVSGRFFVTTLPTIYHAKDGVFRRYRGSRTLEDLQDYIQERKWEAIEPVAGWKSPTSIIMHGMAGLFHLSGWIRQIHNYLTDTLGIHVWGSYAVFILATLLIGLILGLLLVLLADCISPPRYNTEEPELMDQVGDVVEQATSEQVAEEEMTGGQLSDGEEDESQNNSSDDSAVEESATEDDSEQHASHKEEQSSVRQRKNQAAADEL